MTFGSLFTGIGGFDLGFERAGLRCMWQVEIDPYCRRVLEKHWPDVPRWDDVRTFTGDGFERPDVICGGFPCQDISKANPNRTGLAGERSGLWAEFARIVRLVRPRYVVVENVPALLSPLTDDAGRVVGPAPMSGVLGDLAALGFDAEWAMLSAEDCGAPHLRERVFVVAHAADAHRQREQQPEGAHGQERGRAGNRRPAVAHTHGERCNGRPRGSGPGRSARGEGRDAGQSGPCGEAGAHPGGPGLPAPEQPGVSGEAERRKEPRPAVAQPNWWAAEPDVVRVVHGVPRRVDRIRGLGNSVTPQQAETIARWMMGPAG